MVEANWPRIKNEYIHTGISTRELARKYGVSASAVMRRASKEAWVSERKKQRQRIDEKTAKKTAEAISTREADRAARILAASDEMLSRLEQAVTELSRTAVKSKQRVREVEYGEDGAKGKPTREVVRETERVETQDALVNLLGLQQLSAALKNLQGVALSGKASDATLEKVKEIMRRMDNEAGGYIGPPIQGLPEGGETLAE